MKTPVVLLQATCFLLLVSVIAGNDFFTFNQDEVDEDNLDTMLENEYFIHVSDKRHSKQQKMLSSEKHTQWNPPVLIETEPSISKGRSGLPPNSLNKRNIAGDTYQNIYGENYGEVGQQSMVRWENISRISMDENEDMYFSKSDESLQQRSGRHKRDLVYSGEPTENAQVQYRIVNLPKNRPPPTDAQIATSLEEHLQKYLHPTQFEVKVIKIWSNGTVLFDVEYYKSINPIKRIDLARALDDLTKGNKLLINGRYYGIAEPMLEDDVTRVLMAVPCFFCQRYQTCRFQQTNTKWICLALDSRLYPFGLDQGDYTVPEDSEFITSRVRFPTCVPYDGRCFDEIYISANGILSMGEPFSSYTPQACPVYNSRNEKRYAMFPYWSDLDIVSFDPGRVFYQLYVKSYGYYNARTEAILDRAWRDVSWYSNERRFSPTVVLVVTFNYVAPWPAQYNNNERVTFQVVLISNGEVTFARYLYAQGAMNFLPFLNRRVEVCISNRNLDFSRFNYYSFDRVIGNTGEPGHWFFLVGRVPNSRSKCLNWYYNQLSILPQLMWWNEIIPACPCNEIFAIFSFIWIPSYLQQRCYDMFPLFGQLGRRCCYRNDGFLSFENRIPLAGSLQLFTPYFGYPVMHEIEDAAPKRWCCAESELCNLYYIVRPVQSCRGRWTWRAFFFGDPHIQTLDNRAFIFNGLGEYRLLEIDGVAPDNATTHFKLQGRTCRAKTSNGTLSDATVFCALALKNTNGTSVRVSISNSSEYMIIYVDEQDFTARFRDSPSYNYTTSGNMHIQKVNESLKVSTPDGIGITVKLVNNLLEFSFEIDGKFRGMTTGLLGNFNGNNADDFIFPNGTMLRNNSSERELFEYGKAWAVNDSIFVYNPGENSSTFHDPNFVPKFLDEANATDRADAERICGGPSNLACIYDYIATKDKQLATGSKDAISNFQNQETTISNQAPVINGSIQLNVIVNKPSTLTITAKDPDNDNFTYVILSQPDSGNFSYTSNSNFTFIYTPADLDPVNIELIAVDSKNLSSEAANVVIAACSGCNGNGTCNFTELRNTSNSYFMLATCDCEPPYTGDQCEQDKNGCENNPCPSLTNCTDIPASEENITGRSYSCSDCASGYKFEVNGTKCEDIDECENSTCGENANCTNTIGSFICKCHPGFRQTSKGKCVDINECVENQNHCNQICINTFGSYHCACEEGFKLDLMFLNCSKIPNTDPCQNLIQSSNCSYACRNNSGVPQCFCENGLRLASDGYSCEDIDECQENLCSQDCQNSYGSYSCSCYEGYKLAEDLLSCQECEENQFGIQCNSTCNCRGHATSCDRVKGCICETGWTGQYCDEDVDECQTEINDCGRDRFCSNTNGSYDCLCYSGYEDHNGTCVNINECNDITVSQCPHVCEDNNGSFLCMCNAGYKKLANNSCEDIDECQLGISGCEQKCVNMEGSFNCECRLGFILADDRRACVKDSEPCKTTNVTCDYACDIIDDTPVCYCKDGYVLASDNRTCIDNDECASGLDLCTNECENTPGSYNCSCPDGMQLLGDARTCQACDGYYWGRNCANECACDPKGSSHCDPVSGCVCKPGWGGNTCNEDQDECSWNQTVCPGSNCINTIGSYLCQCSPGFTLDSNKACIDIDECERDPCDHFCNNTIGSYKCSCHQGFISSDTKCTDIDECATPQLSKCDQLCRNTQGGFACECYEGYVLNTTTRNTCYRDPSAVTCGSATTCSDICIIQNGNEVCYCPPGFQLSGNSTCTDINECMINKPCINGNCSNIDGSFICSCAAGMELAADDKTCQECDYGFYGMNCSNNCTCNMANTKQCLATNGSCICYDGWEGTTCSADIDECTVSSNPCQNNSRCINIPGSHKCVCKEGFFPTNGTCAACDDTHYGQDCLNACRCNFANTLDCNDETGACRCQSGWSGITCDDDINECNATPNYCSLNETCNNLNGSAECRCNLGYWRPNSGDNCTACDDTHYGQDCQYRCSCNSANTADCDDETGVCSCKPGWSGSTCDSDLSACSNPNYCSLNETCNNLNGSAECRCNLGYWRPISGDNCTACDDTHYGQDCQYRCSCNSANTADCDDETGVCRCQSGWSGITCDDDINECNATPNYCSVNEICNNLNGSAECRCNLGYWRPNSGDNCTAGVQMDLTIYFDASKFNNTPDLTNALEEELQKMIQSFPDSSRAKIKVLNITDLSQRANGTWRGAVRTIIYAGSDSENPNQAQSSAAKLASKILSDGLKISDTSVKVVDIEIENQKLDAHATACDIFNKLVNCSSGQSCDETTASCKPEKTDQPKTDLIIGLAVGLPLFVILAIVVGILACLYVRRKRKGVPHSSSDSVDHAAPFRNMFPTRASTKGSWGAPQRMYSPDAYSETGTIESTTGRPKGRSDFQDSAWYDNKGATPTDAPSTGTPPMGPTSNFSWEYMFKLLEPHKDFEIQRPFYETSPNPTFLTGGKPDSAA